MSHAIADLIADLRLEAKRLREQADKAADYELAEAKRIAADEIEGAADDVERGVDFRRWLMEGCP